MSVKVYTVFPSYYIGDNSPEIYTPEELRLFLIDELDQTREAGAQPLSLSTPLVDLLGRTDRRTLRRKGFWQFDVTRPGCVQGTLAVHAGDQIENSDV